MARADAKLKTLPEEIQAEMWRMVTTPVDAEGRPCAPADGSAMTAVDVLAWLSDTHGVESSTGAFSEWRRWFPLQRRISSAHATVEQAMEERKRLDPSLSPDELMAFGQIVFSMEALNERDAKGFARFADIAERRAARLQEAEKFKASQRSKIEAGLDALAETIKGNQEAEAAYNHLRKVIAEATK
ncbi:MAG TPA: hypothetical protein PLA50_05205 [Bacteroidia bacterium]|nr:hypothetical protein [Bacteroidia bacterium]